MPSDGWYKDFRTRLNNVLVQRRIQSKELAAALGVSANTIARWRNARTTRGISVDALVNVSEYLEMSPAEWFLESRRMSHVDDKLRRVLKYMESLDGPQLDHFLTVVNWMIDFAEGRPGKVEVHSE